MMRRPDMLHPRTASLRRWLDTGAGRGVARHTERCERCAARLDDIAPPYDATLSSTLGAALAPPEGLGTDVRRRIDDTRRADSDLAFVAGLLSVGLDAARLMILPPVTDRTHEETS